MSRFISIVSCLPFSNQVSKYSQIVMVDESLTDVEINDLVHAHIASRGYSDLTSYDYDWSFITLLEFIKE